MYENCSKECEKATAILQGPFFIIVKREAIIPHSIITRPIQKHYVSAIPSKMFAHEHDIVIIARFCHIMLRHRNLN